MLKLKHFATGKVAYIELEKGNKLQNYAADIEEFCGAKLNKIRFLCPKANEKINPSTTDLNKLLGNSLVEDDFELSRGNLRKPFEFKPKAIVSKPLHFVIMKNKKIYDRISMKNATNVTMMYGVYRYLCKNIKGNWTTMKMHIDKYGATPELLRDEKLSLKNEYYKFLTYEVGYFIFDCNIVVTIGDRLHKTFNVSKGILTSVILEVQAKHYHFTSLPIVVIGSNTINVDCTPDTTVESLKKSVGIQVGYLASQVRLVCSGKQLRGAKTLRSYGITASDVIYLAVRMPGGGYPTITFVDVTKQLIETHEWSSSAPEWRIVEKGLVIEGICKTRNCIAKNKMVCCSLGFGRIDIINERYKIVCPMCKRHVKPEHPGFNNCSFTITAIKEEDGTRSEWSKKAFNAYTVFSKATSGEATFIRLEIFTEELRHDEEKFQGSVEKICVICDRQLPIADAKEAGCGKHYFHKDCFMYGNNGEPFDYCPKCE